MVRLIASIVGAAFVFVLAIALFGTVKTAVTDPAPESVEHEFHLKPASWDLSSSGLFGTFDKRQVQRGFQVYQEVCSACHSLKYVHFRDLKQLGYSEAEVKAIATNWKIEQPTVNPDTGEVATRKNVPADTFPSPFANEVAARAANNNALPPDLSLITKGREDGSNYVPSLLTGYRDQPGYKNADGKDLLKEFPGAKTPDGLYFNPYFANLNIAMPPPLLQDGQVTYTDGTAPTTKNMARDVAAFLTWTAEPNLEARHQAGFAAVVFLIVFIGLAWGAYKNVWRDQAH